ncbi:AlwI restriction endonuclease [Vreelandella subterranea]|uniref:AlwI restriction endonuclease n=2 Tax=Vreelandella subterranea TaxID=416874 RepID=A0A1H9VQU1_9GAMM|nr:AlwI restriction endonuclease [Halomonas subterranea]
MMLWHIGNTTVRTPYRLRDALRVLQGSPLNGNISGRAQENTFAYLLHDEGILNAPRVTEGKDASDLGRKWRAALSQLGFITPQLTRGIHSGTTDPVLAASTEDIEQLSGRPYEITPNGYRLAHSEIITAQQECFLRSLASYRIPSPIEKQYTGDSFSPLRFTLRVMQGLAEGGHVATLSFQEFALFVQTSTPANGINNTVRKIVNFRQGRDEARGNVRAYDRRFYEDIAAEIDRQTSTLDDYADLSFRYLKATGLFRTAGRGIALSQPRAQLAALLLDEEETTLDNKPYFYALWQGAELPTDNAESSNTVVQDLVEQLQDRGVQVEAPAADTPLPDLEQFRHELDAMLLQLDEQEYADRQADELDEIMAWLEAIPTRGSATLPDGNRVTIPRGEGPVYLEWAIWRAFLAMDSLCNPPWEARRFQIDQDFLPVNCAPGGGPDMVFEFEDAIIVVEVTLTTSSRQEAAEGEPVRRHVAQYTETSTKPVYGLFIAVQIDSNTAHTFRSGDWYLSDDSKISLDIVPLTLGDFGNFLASGSERLADMPGLLRQLMIECRARANQDAPQWKQSIRAIVQRVSGHGGAV